MCRQTSIGKQKRGCRRRLRGGCTLYLLGELCDITGITFFSFFSCIKINIHTLLNLQSSREQLAIAEFARSLLVIPKTLAVNAAQDATDLVAKLRAYHNSSITKPELVDLKW